MTKVQLLVFVNGTSFYLSRWPTSNLVGKGGGGGDGKLDYMQRCKKLNIYVQV